MKKTDLIVPRVMQIVLDDVGWFYGRDSRDWGGPARTGFPREHVVEDYIILEELGKALDMKLSCMFVIGEWDRKGILAKVPNATAAGKRWQGSRYYNEQKANEIFDYLQNSNYIEFGVHGLMHDIWADDGKYLGGGEFFLPKGMIRETPGDYLELGSDEHLRAHFDAFFEIYNDWGFKDPIRCFTSPCGGRDALPEGRMTKMLANYGIRFWHNDFWVDDKGDKMPKSKTVVQNGVICNGKGYSLGPWEGYDLDPDIMPDIPYEEAGLLSGHWPNMLRLSPRKNLENLGAWVGFFRRQAEHFGLMLSRDVEFAHYQQLYGNFAEVMEKDGAVMLDLTRADAAFPFGERPAIYISVKKDAGEIKAEGGSAAMYEIKKDFITYRIDRTDSSVITIK